jgi:hypothetical protein
LFSLHLHGSQACPSAISTFSHVLCTKEKKNIHEQ